MNINAVTAANPVQINQKVPVRDNLVRNDAEVLEGHDKYVPSVKTEDSTITYDKPKVNSPDIEMLLDETKRIAVNLRSMVEDLLKRQGMSFRDAYTGKTVLIDESAKKIALASISDGGILSPEIVSRRIIDFAIAISGGDRSRFETLKAGIDDGFQKAAEVWGGQLPDISHKTYDLAMEKLNKWAGIRN